MRVRWQEFYYPHGAEDYEDWHSLPPTKYEGEIISTVRSWGDTVFVVMLDSGQVREIKASRVERAK